MARKNPFGSTLAKAMAEGTDFNEDELDDGTAPPAKGAASPTVARAIVALKEDDKQSTRMISPSLIRMSAIQDRLDPEQDLEELIASIREDGQKVPILVRRLPNGEMEVVYGRRRLLACRALKQDVRAMVMEMTDEEALIAQGVENNQRKDTSFIERALFAQRIHDAGFRVEVLQKVIGVDESLVRKMRGIASAIPEALIKRIGPAPAAGRRQWEALKKLCVSLGEERAAALAKKVDPDVPSSERLSLLLASSAPAPVTSPLPVSAVSGHIDKKRAKKRLILLAKTGEDDAFLSFLESRVLDLYDEWKKK